MPITPGGQLMWTFGTPPHNDVLACAMPGRAITYRILWAAPPFKGMTWSDDQPVWSGCGRTGRSYRICAAESDSPGTRAPPAPGDHPRGRTSAWDGIEAGQIGAGPCGRTIQIDGQTVQYERRQGHAASLLARQQRAIRRKVGMVFQQFNLFPHMTALANVTLAPYHVLGISKAQADSEANELLRLVSLADKSAPIPTNFRAVSNSASPSPGRFPCARRSYCSMR